MVLLIQLLLVHTTFSDFDTFQGRSSVKQFKL